MSRMRGPSVRWRSGGHQLDPASDVLRFEVADLNRVITGSVANADLYRPLQDDRAHPADWQVLTLSCFAVTPQWTPRRLAVDTGFRSYRLARAATLASAGHDLWPTEVFVDDVPDPRNEVHYDLVVASGPDLIPAELLSGAKAARREAREHLRPLFERVLVLLGDPLPLE
jgi:hypothetical protein